MKILKLTFSLILTAFFAVTLNAQKAADLKKTDFENFTHRVKNASIKIKNGLQIGSCKKDADGFDTGEIWNVDKTNIAYGDLDGDGKAEAIVPMIANICGANMLTDEAVLVYTMKAGKAVKLAELEYQDDVCKAGEENCGYERAVGVTVAYDAAAKAIVVANYFATGDDARCCPSFLRKTWFRRTGAKFVEFKKGKLEAAKQEKL